MKNLSGIIIAFLFFIAFPALVRAQPTSRQSTIRTTPQTEIITPSKVRLRTSKGIKVLDYVPAAKLKEGSNYVRFGKRRMFVGVKKGKVLSVKTMNPMGQWGPNVLSSGQQIQEFTCIGGICWCAGDKDCNDMFVSAVCGDAAVCIDDKCYCAQN